MSGRSILESIQQMAGTQLTDKVYMVPCSVDSVDLSTRSCECTPIGGKAATTIAGIQLMAEVDDGLLLVPVIDSTVIVCYSERNVPYIALYSELDQVLCVAKKGIQFQGGEFGGLVIIQSLITKINNLENAYNDLVTKFNAHVHILTLSSGTGTAAPTIMQETTTLTPTIRADIENTAIKHGA